MARVTGITGEKAGNYQLPEEGLTQGYSITKAKASVSKPPVAKTGLYATGTA